MPIFAPAVSCEAIESRDVEDVAVGILEELDVMLTEVGEACVVAMLVLLVVVLPIVVATTTVVIGVGLPKSTVGLAPPPEHDNPTVL